MRAIISKGLCVTRAKAVSDVDQPPYAYNCVSSTNTTNYRISNNQYIVEIQKYFIINLLTQGVRERGM